MRRWTRWAGTRRGAWQENAPPAFPWPERGGEPLADNGEVAEVADFPRVHAGGVVDLPAVTDRADDLLSDAERLRKQPRLAVRFDQASSDPEQEPPDAEVLVGTGPVLRLTPHACVRDAEVQLDPGGCGVELRHDADRFNGIQVDVELVLDIGDDLHKPGKLDAQGVPVGDGMNVLVLRRLDGASPGGLGHRQQLEGHAVHVDELRLREASHLRAPQPSSDDLLAQQLGLEGAEAENLGDVTGVPAFAEHVDRDQAANLLARLSDFPDGGHDLAGSFCGSVSFSRLGFLQVRRSRCGP